MTMSQQDCPESFCGFDFEDLKVWFSQKPDFLAITHNPDKVLLQFSGWSINLYRDGSYAVEITEGG